MIDIDSILSQEKTSDIISSLKERTTTAPQWGLLVKDYDPKLHGIVSDTNGRKDKHHQDGTTDKAARLTLGLEKLLTKRMTAFTFGVPVKRVYVTNGEKQAEIASILEKIYKVAHIDTENNKRGENYYASCEALTVWYVKKENHNLYGFPCKWKLKCKTLSPMDGVDLYPLIDENGEMYAMSYQYTKKVKDETWTFFETYTSDKHFKWVMKGDAEWEADKEEEFEIGKIPAVYIYRPRPIWDGLNDLREDIEYSLSRNSDVIAYNSAPILKVAGTLIGEEAKGESRRVYRVSEGGDVSYVSWAQSITALEYHVRTLLNMYFMQAQLPDISFENMRGLGNIGYDARKMMFTDSHMKVRDESGAWVEFLEREGNVLKAFLKKMNTKLSPSDIDAVGIEHVITPYIQEDDATKIATWKDAGGIPAVVSPVEAIQRAGFAKDPQQAWADILASQMALNAKPTEENGTE